MKFGFNYMTDEARDQLEKDGVMIRREPISGSFMWTVMPDISDILEDDLQNRMPDSSPDRMEFAELAKKRKSQTMRHWYCKDTEKYYYLIRDHVYECSTRKTLDYSTNPPTVNAKTVFDLMEDPGSIEDILRARYPSFGGRYALF